MLNDYHAEESLQNFVADHSFIQDSKTYFYRFGFNFKIPEDFRSSLMSTRGCDLGADCDAGGLDFESCPFDSVDGSYDCNYGAGHIINGELILEKGVLFKEAEEKLVQYSDLYGSDCATGSNDACAPSIGLYCHQTDETCQAMPKIGNVCESASDCIDPDFGYPILECKTFSEGTANLQKNCSNY